MSMDAGTSGVPSKFEPKRMVGIAFVVFALAGGMFLSHVIAAIFNGFGWNDGALLGIEELTRSSLLGFVIAVGAAVYFYFNHGVRTAGLDVATELKRVTWPSIAETRVSTVAVIVASSVSALILFVFDFMSSKVMTAWVPQALEWLQQVFA